jgi:hypothetical protein
MQLNMGMTAVTSLDRDGWLLADDEQLLADCRQDLYRASGPGGQHRNKTESAVRLIHQPTGITVTATERRCQHENRATAVRRLREAIAEQVRCPLELAGFRLPPLLAGTTAAGRVLIGRRDSRYFVLVAWILDAIAASGGRVPDAARAFGLTSSQVVAMLKREPKRLAAANAIRRKAGLAPLR